MKQYLTISEFAKLRGVDVNSLRYYEKLQVLKPAWVDPQTRYRYYLPEQLIILDIILLLIQLGIPLKNMKEYIDTDGNIDKKRIMEDGKAAMQRRIEQMQQGLELIQFDLDCTERNREFSHRDGIYTREIPARFLLINPDIERLDDNLRKEKAAMELFHHAQEQGLIPVFPPGILLRPQDGSYSFSFFFQVLHPTESLDGLLYVPAGRFSCLQADLTPQTRLSQLLEENFSAQAGQTVIISNMSLDRLYFDSRHSEIQVPQFPFPE